ncbi:hypothetical protein FRB96_004421 [Tulasnella sp. 330]|nr:hypothetical protein FRB96_004421 [Tulasnella sp. 330]KAG8884508.1 hypothetical protein FRB97_004021 [Tulasnella sp. 331]
MTVSKNPSAPLVVVVGATGAQGFSVIKALSESDKPYRLRGLTRDVSKTKSKDLAAQGVEMVAVEPRPDNKDQIVKAFQDADVVFAVTVLAMQQMELAEGKMLVDSAKAANVKLLVWSGLESTSEASGGKYRVPAFDNKNEITKYARASGIPKVVNVMAPMYFENFMNLSVTPRKQPDGSYAIFCVCPPESIMPAIYTKHDYGLFVRKAIEVPNSPEELYAYGELISWKQIAQELGEGTGKDVKYVHQSDEDFIKDFVLLGLPEFVAKSLLAMYLSAVEFNYYGKKDIKGNLDGLARKPLTWREFVRVSDWSKILN